MCDGFDVPVRFGVDEEEKGEEQEGTGIEAGGEGGPVRT